MLKNMSIKYITLSLVMLFAIGLYLLGWIPSYIEKYPNLINKDVTMKLIDGRFKIVIVVIVSVAFTAIGSLKFQTVTESNILTPSVMGFDVTYIASQSAIVMFFGTTSLLITNSYINFIVNTIIMTLVSLWIFKVTTFKRKTNIGMMLIVGLIITTLMSNVSTFLRVMMSPENFDAVTAVVNANIKMVNMEIFIFVAPILIAIFIYFMANNKKYDVVALGKENATSLGIDHQKVVTKTLILVSIGTAAATALIGPMVFLGLIAVNMAKQIFKTNKHKHIMISSSMIGISFVLIAQFLADEFKVLPTFTTVVSLVGGIYLIYMISKEAKKW